MVEWEKVVDVAGDLMEPLDIYPPRFRVAGFLPKSNWRRWGTC